MDEFYPMWERRKRKRARTLTKIEKMVLGLRMHGARHKEIADILDIKTKSSSGINSRANKKLRANPELITSQELHDFYMLHINAIAMKYYLAPTHTIAGREAALSHCLHLGHKPSKSNASSHKVNKSERWISKKSDFHPTWEKSKRMLSDNQKLILAMKMRHFKHKEISEILDISMAAIRSSMCRASMKIYRFPEIINNIELQKIYVTKCQPLINKFLIENCFIHNCSKDHI